MVDKETNTDECHGVEYEITFNKNSKAHDSDDTLFDDIEGVAATCECTFSDASDPDSNICKIKVLCSCENNKSFSLNKPTGPNYKVTKIPNPL